MQIKVSARESELSKAQVVEVLKELKQLQGDVSFETHYVKTYGDLDLKTSLLDVDKTDFFTREVDQKILDETCDIAIHSAKDLPASLETGLEVIALTQGVCSKDCLVLRDKEDLGSLPIGAKIGTSSDRRVEMIKSFRKDLVTKDIRGDILSRLKQLNERDFDGLVIANAALIRLNLSVNKIFLEGNVAKGQGQLAIVAMSRREDLKDFFEPLDVRAIK